MSARSDAKPAGAGSRAVKVAGFLHTTGAWVFLVLVLPFLDWSAPWIAVAVGVAYLSAAPFLWYRLTRLPRDEAKLDDRVRTRWGKAVLAAQALAMWWVVTSAVWSLSDGLQLPRWAYVTAAAAGGGAFLLEVAARQAARRRSSP